MKKLFLFLIILLVISFPVNAAYCFDVLQSKSTEGFLNEISTLNLNSCDATVPPPADRFLKDEVISVEISMQENSTKYFNVITQEGEITKVGTGRASEPTFIVEVGECEFDTMLRSNNKLGLIAYLYLNDEIDLTAVGFFNKIKFGLIKLFANPIFKRIQSAETIACSGNI